MKTTTMKKTLLGLAALLLVSLLGFNQEVKAQVNITTSATLVQQIEITPVQNLAFGNILNEENVVKAIDVDGQAINTGSPDLGGTVTAGQFDISKAANINTLLTLTASDLEFGTDSLTLSLDGGNFGRLTADSIDEFNFNPSTPLLISSTETADYFPVTSFSLFVGGSITVTSATLADGEYTGTITLTAVYN